MKKTLPVVFVLICLASAAFAGESLSFLKMPSVEMALISPVALTRGRPSRVQLNFRIQRGFHINSNRPNDEALIPTSLRLSPPTDVLVGRIAYPAGQDLTFDFMPGEKLNVYANDFTVTAMVTTSRTIPSGTYRVHGALKYQACDNRQCYPAKEVPVQFDVKVQKQTVRHVRGNPGQSPHVHQ
jgi:hypothetical protein